MENYLILRAGPNFRLGSGTSVEDEMAMFSALCGFFKKNELCAYVLDLPTGSWDGFELRANDFTEKGLAVVKCGLHKWITALDKGKSPNDVSILEKCLAKIA